MMPRFCTCAFLALALAACHGGGGGGAISVRWRIGNLSTGETFDPMSAAANDGSCCAELDNSGNCAVTAIWVVRSVSITLRDPSTGEAIAGVASPTFPCKNRESTTAFDLPPGTFAIGVCAAVFDGRGAPAPSAVPPPEVRTIIRGEVVNLQDVEIGVQPLPSTGVGVPLPCGAPMVTF